MNNNCLFSLQGSFLLGIDIEEANKLTLKSLIRAAKAKEGIIYAPRYDMNKDGVIDEVDLTVIKRALLGLK